MPTERLIPAAGVDGHTVRHLQTTCCIPNEDGERERERKEKNAVQRPRRELDRKEKRVQTLPPFSVITLCPAEGIAGSNCDVSAFNMQESIVTTGSCN